VTAFLDLSEDRSKDKSFDKCFSLFQTVVDSGIKICLFVSSTFYERALEISKKNKNIYLMPVTELSDLWTYRITKMISDITLPEEKLSHHDTFNFMVLMNAKIEFVSKAIEVNPFQTNHFAWIDFSIGHVLHSPNSLKRLYTYSISALRDKMLAFPVCWSKAYLDKQYNNLYSKVLWRFCGGFFIGDKDSLLEFNDAYRKNYFNFLNERKRLVWEVNFWCWLEKNKYIFPESYLANHNDSIIQIPSKYLKTVVCLTAIPPRFERCKKTIYSLLNQADHIYLSTSKYYVRFGYSKLPDFSSEKEFEGRVSVIESTDFGPATKYLGALTKIPDNYWVIFCDDDQIYRSDMIKRMKDSICEIGSYQNCYNSVRSGSGGIIHGYVGNMFYRGLLNRLSFFDLPFCARFVDDQWMSLYCFYNKIQIFPTSIQNYYDLLTVLQNGYEQIGEAPLAALGNRDEKVAELANYFRIVFKPEGVIERV
jgi:hypothetical protein